jgi:hypothetical protein
VDLVEDDHRPLARIRRVGQEHLGGGEERLVRDDRPEPLVTDRVDGPPVTLRPQRQRRRPRRCRRRRPCPTTAIASEGTTTRTREICPSAASSWATSRPKRVLPEPGHASTRRGSRPSRDRTIRMASACQDRNGAVLGLSQSAEKRTLTTDCAVLPLRRLQEPQIAWRFSLLVRPPRLHGTMWSPCIRSKGIARLQRLQTQPCNCHARQVS